MPSPKPIIPPEVLAHNERMNRIALDEWATSHPGALDMPKVSQMLISKYINKGDVDVPLIVTIRACTFDPGDARGLDQPKWLMWFQEHRKPLKLNNTILKYLEKYLGDNSEGWIGQRVQLYLDPNVTMGQELVGGVRLRVGKSQAARAMSAQTAHFQTSSAPALEHHANPLASLHRAAPQAERVPAADAEFVDTSTGELRAGADPDFDDEIPF